MRLNILFKTRSLLSIAVVAAIFLTTFPCAANASPTISNVSSNNDKTTATVTWTTNEIASSQLEYGATRSYGTLSAETDASPRVTSHSVTISGLNKCQTYHYRTISTDDSHNTATSSDANFFTTGCSDIYSCNETCDDTNPNSIIHVWNSGDIISVRNAIISDIWSGAGFPTRQPDSITQNVSIASYLDTSGMANLSRVDQIDMNLDNDFTSRIYHLIPIVGNNRLAIFVMGHADDLNAASGKETIQFFIQHGFSVLGVFMPMTGPNKGPVSGITSVAHNNMKALESPTFNPLEIFLEPIAIALNYTDANYNYQNITMIGISGGGWTTDIYSALDTRIKKSFSVAGSLPIYLRRPPCGPMNGVNNGDYEQGNNGGKPATLYANIASYLDFYLLGSIGPGRKHTQILNYYDNCCFMGPQFNLYKQTTADLATELGGTFDIASDVSFSDDHKISDWARQSVILPNLKETVTIVESKNLTKVMEGGAVDAYTVVLNSKPIADVRMSLTPNDTAHGATVIPATLTFTSANWNNPQTITVTAVNDGLDEGAHTATISHTLTSADELYDKIAVNDVTINISDPVSPVFTSNLKFGITAGEVKQLQIFLNSDPDTQLTKSELDSTGSPQVGSPGKETNFFGSLTKAAVIKFQEKYAKDILAPWKLTQGTGFVGKTTRIKLNELILNL